MVTPIVGSIDYYDEDGIDHHAGKITFFHVDLNSAVRTNLDPLNVLDHNPSTAPLILLGATFYLYKRPPFTNELGLKRIFMCVTSLLK